jgi:hypothetical protein
LIVLYENTRRLFLQHRRQPLKEQRRHKGPSQLRPDKASNVRDIQDVLANVGEQHERPAGWISRRPWMFHGKGKLGAMRDADRQEEKARRIMEAHPHLSCRKITYLLRKNGIPRNPEWIRQNPVSAN